MRIKQCKYCGREKIVEGVVGWGRKGCRKERRGEMDSGLKMVPTFAFPSKQIQMFATASMKANGRHSASLIRVLQCLLPVPATDREVEA